MTDRVLTREQLADLLDAYRPEGGWIFEIQRDVPLNANHSLHWSAKRELVKALRDEAWANARRLRIPHHRKVRVQLYFVVPDNQRRDSGNIQPSLKAIVDGLVDARVVPDDTPAHVETPEPVLLEKIDGHGHLLVAIEGLL